MAPTMGINSNSGNGQNGDSPLSKTYQYRKIMKPMLERKRRARINRCLDELKELITGALQNVSKVQSRRRQTEASEYFTSLPRLNLVTLIISS